MSFRLRAVIDPKCRSSPIIDRRLIIVSCACQPSCEVALWSYVCDISKGQFDYVDTAFFESYPGISATAKGVEEHELVRGYREHAAAAAAAASPGAAGL